MLSWKPLSSRTSIGVEVATRSPSVRGAVHHLIAALLLMCLTYHTECDFIPLEKTDAVAPGSSFCTSAIRSPTLISRGLRKNRHFSFLDGRWTSRARRPCLCLSDTSAKQRGFTFGLCMNRNVYSRKRIGSFPRGCNGSTLPLEGSCVL